MSTHQTDATIDRLWDYDHPAQSEARFQEYLIQLTVGEATYVEVLTQIARAQGLQRHFTTAHATLAQAAGLLVGQPVRVRIRYQLELGRVFNSAGDRQSAQAEFTNAWLLANTSGEEVYAIDAAHMLAIVAPPEQQDSWNQQALILAEESSDPRAQRWVAALHNNMGWTDFAAGDFAAALDHFQRALVAREAQGNPASIHIARWSVAKALRALGRVEEALAIQTQLLAEGNATGTADGYVDEELGECYLALQQPATAQPHFARAYQLLAQDPWLVEHEAARLQRLQMLGNTAG